jgi:hypothetical protein
VHDAKARTRFATNRLDSSLAEQKTVRYVLVRTILQTRRVRSLIGDSLREKKTLRRIALD